MSLLTSIKRSVPDSLKRKLRQHTTRSRLAASLGPYLPELLCIDVGASYYPHGRWHVMLESPATRWVAVEPNEQNLGYRARLRRCLALAPPYVEPPRAWRETR